MTQPVNIQGTLVPGIKVRKADTGVELMAGQTLAIAGLVAKSLGVREQRPALDQRSALPGRLVPKSARTTNEVELLIMVTPELVEAMDASEVPPCGPGHAHHRARAIGNCS